MALPSDNKRLPDASVVLGTNTNTGGKDITITDDERVRHISVVGATGTGKSTLLKGLALQAVEKCESVVFIDVDGRNITDLLVRIPQERMKDVIYLDFSIDPSRDIQPTDRYIGINHLAGKTRREVERYVELFKRLWKIPPEYANLELTLRASLLTLWYNKATLTEMPDLLRDKEFRSRCIANIPNSPDAYFVHWFWKHHLLLHYLQEELRLSDSTLNKGLQLLIDPSTFYIVSQETTTLHFEEIIENKKILLIRLSKQILGDETVRRIGAMILEELKHALFSRPDLPHLDLVNLICDEWQMYLTPDFFDDVLSQGRRYGISTVLATQTLENFDDKLQAIIDQVGTHITFAVGRTDALKLAIRYARDPLPETEIERKLGIVREPIQWLLSVRGVQDKPAIDKFIDKRLTIFSDVIKESHQEVVDAGGKTIRGRRSITTISFGVRSIHKPVSELDTLCRELNRILCKVMVEKNPREIIPIDIFFEFAEALGLSFPLLRMMFFTSDEITAGIFSVYAGAYMDQEYREYVKEINQVKQTIQSSVDASVERLKEAFFLLWTSISSEEVEEIIAQMVQECYKVLPAWNYELIRPYDDLLREKYKIEERLARLQADLSNAQQNLSYLEENEQAILSDIEGQSYEEWLCRDSQWRAVVKQEVEKLKRSDLKRYGIVLVSTRVIELMLLLVSLLMLLPCIAAEIWLVEGTISNLNAPDGPLWQGHFLAFLMFIFSPVTLAVFLLPLVGAVWVIMWFMKGIEVVHEEDNIYYDIQFDDVDDGTFELIKPPKKQVASVQERAFEDYREALKRTVREQKGKLYEQKKRFSYERLHTQTTLKSVQKAIQEEQDRVLSIKSRLLGTAEESALQQEIRDFATFVFELREFMEALAYDPPLDTSRWKEKEVVRRPHVDMREEKTKELLGLPDGIAYVAIRMRGDRFKPRMKTKQLEPVKEGKRFLNIEEIATLLQERRVQALKNAEAYTTEARKIDEAFWKRRQHSGIAPSPVVQPPPEEKEKEAPVPVSHAKRRTQEFSLSLVSDFKLPDNATEENLLKLLSWFGYLDIENIARLVHQVPRREDVKDYQKNDLRDNPIRGLNKLKSNGLIEVNNKPRKELSRGRIPIVYSITDKGIKRVKEQKVKVELDSHLMHLNDLLVSAVLLPIVEPRITLAHFEHLSLKQRPLPIGNNNSVIPDGFISYSLGEPYGVTGEIAGICFEWDEETESLSQLKDKFTDYVTAASGAYQERFGTDSLTIAFCCQDEKRATRMLKLAEQVLDKNRSYAELFLFGAVDPSVIDPLQLMTAPLFKQPFASNTPCSLIETLNQAQQIQQVPDMPQPQAYQPYEQGYQRQQPETEYTGIQQMPYAQEAQEQQIIQPLKQENSTPLSPAQPQQPVQPEKFAISPKLHLPVKQTIDKQPVLPVPTSDAQLEQPILSYEQQLELLGQAMYNLYVEEIRIMGLQPLNYKDWYKQVFLLCMRVFLTEERYNQEVQKGLITPSVSYAEWCSYEINKLLEERK